MASETKWYCLRVVSNKERKIKERLDLEIDRNGWRDSIPNIIVATEKVYKIRNGKKVVLDRTLTPGYILVEAVIKKSPTGNKSALNGTIIQAITSIKDVIHFLGKKNPIPMRDNEITRILSKVDESSEQGNHLQNLSWLEKMSKLQMVTLKILQVSLKWLMKKRRKSLSLPNYLVVRPRLN